MKREEFLHQLSGGLEDLPENERKDVLFDYEEHFDIGKEEGKSEEEIADSLGNPKHIAKELKADYHINQARENKSVGNVSKAIIATLSLGFFNLIFVLGPFVAMVSVLVAFYMATITILVSPILILIKAFISEDSMWLEALFNMMALGGLGVLLVIGMIFVTKGVYFITIKYLQFNLKIIRGQ